MHKYGNIHHSNMASTFYQQLPQEGIGHAHTNTIITLVFCVVLAFRSNKRDVGGAGACSPKVNNTHYQQNNMNNAHCYAIMQALIRSTAERG